MILRCVSPAQTSLWNARLTYSTVPWISVWICNSHHKLIVSKTEFVNIPYKTLLYVHPPVSVDSSFILWVTKAKNIGVILHSSLSYCPLHPNYPQMLLALHVNYVKSLTPPHHLTCPPWFKLPSPLTCFVAIARREVFSLAMPRSTLNTAAGMMVS